MVKGISSWFTCLQYVVSKPLLLCIQSLPFNFTESIPLSFHDAVQSMMASDRNGEQSLSRVCFGFFKGLPLTLKLSDAQSRVILVALIFVYSFLVSILIDSRPKIYSVLCLSGLMSGSLFH